MERTYKKIDVEGKKSVEYTDSSTHVISLEQLDQKLFNLEKERLEVQKMIDVIKRPSAS